MKEEKKPGKGTAAERRLFTVNDACTYLSISRMSLYRLIKQEKISPLMISGRTLFDRKDLDELIETSKSSTKRNR